MTFVVSVEPCFSISAFSISAEKSHPLNSVAQAATVLNDVFPFSGQSCLQHRLFAKRE